MKKNSKKHTAYIVYEYDQAEQDYNNIAEYLSIKELEEEERKKKRITVENIRSLYHGISNSLDTVKTYINDKYIIIKEVY